MDLEYAQQYAQKLFEAGSELKAFVAAKGVHLEAFVAKHGCRPEQFLEAIDLQRVHYVTDALARHGHPLDSEQIWEVTLEGRRDWEAEHREDEEAKPHLLTESEYGELKTLETKVIALHGVVKEIILFRVYSDQRDCTATGIQTFEYGFGSGLLSTTQWRRDLSAMLAAAQAIAGFEHADASDVSEKQTTITRVGRNAADHDLLDRLLPNIKRARVTQEQVCLLLRETKAGANSLLRTWREHDAKKKAASSDATSP